MEKLKIKKGQNMLNSGVSRPGFWGSSCICTCLLTKNISIQIIEIFPIINSINTLQELK